MKNIKITQSSVMSLDGTGETTLVFARATQVPIYGQSQDEPIAEITIIHYSDASLTDEQLEAENKTASHFCIEERRPADHSGPQLQTLFDGRAYGKPVALEIGEETHPHTRYKAASGIATDIRDFICD